MVCGPPPNKKILFTIFNFAKWKEGPHPINKIYTMFVLYTPIGLKIEQPIRLLKTSTALSYSQNNLYWIGP